MMVPKGRTRKLSRGQLRTRWQYERVRCTRQTTRARNVVWSANCPGAAELRQTTVTRRIEVVLLAAVEASFSEALVQSPTSSFGDSGRSAKGGCPKLRDPNLTPSTSLPVSFEYGV